MLSSEVPNRNKGGKMRKRTIMVLLVLGLLLGGTAMPILADGPGLPPLCTPGRPECPVGAMQLNSEAMNLSHSNSPLK
jgi:hypothetical protein